MQAHLLLMFNAADVYHVFLVGCTLVGCHHWRPNLPGGCCICLEQSAGVSTRIAVTASFSQQTEDWAFCPVVQLFWLRASHCTDYHGTSLLFLRVTFSCSLRTYATLKFIRSSSSSSSSSSSLCSMDIVRLSVRPSVRLSFVCLSVPYRLLTRNWRGVQKPKLAEVAQKSDGRWPHSMSVLGRLFSSYVECFTDVLHASRSACLLYE